MDYRHQPDDEAGGWSWSWARALANDVKDMQTQAIWAAGEWHVGLQQGASQRNQYATAEGSRTLLDGSLHALRYISRAWRWSPRTA